MNITKCSLVSFLTLLLCACGGSNTLQEGINGKVTLGGYEGKTVYLETTSSSPVKVDSAIVENGKFAFSLNDAEPQVYTLVLATSADDQYPITLPVVSEKGRIAVTMGELVLTSGTPMNDALQDFLLAVSNLIDKAMTADTPDLEQVKTDFSRLVEGAVLQNIQTPVGAYIYRTYNDRLDDTQKARILQTADENFEKGIK